MSTPTMARVAPKVAATAGPEPPLERRSYGDALFRTTLTIAAVAIPVLLGFLVNELWVGSRLAIGEFGLGFVTSSEWNPVTGRFGALPLVFGTLFSSFLALLIAVPL